MQPDIGTILLGSLGLILLGTASVVASAIIAGSRGQSQDDAMLMSLLIAGWSLIAIGFFAFCLFLFGPLGILFGMTAVVVAGEIFAKHRTARQRALLSVLAAAAERSLPLVPVVAAFARERSGRFARRARRLADKLIDGISLPDALEQVRGLAPVDALPVIRIGHQSGALAGALRQVAVGPDSRNQLWFSVAGKLQYLGGLVVFGVCIITFVMISIIPEFSKIFADFGMELPPMTMLLIDVSAFLAATWFLFFLIFMAACLLAIYAELRYLGVIHWGLPGFDWVVRRLDAAVIFDALAFASARRCPLEESIGLLADTYHKASIRRRLRNVLCDLESGADWLDCFRQRGLAKQADVAVLRAAQRVGNLSWALREMADSSRRRLAYRLYALLQVAFPLILLALGALVMFFVVSLFIPLIILIESMTLP